MSTRDLTILILGLLLGIPFSILANLANPWVVSYFKNSSLSIRERRISVIIDEYKRIQEFRQSPMLISVMFFQHTALGLNVVIVLLMFVIIANVFPVTDVQSRFPFIYSIFKYIGGPLTVLVVFLMSLQANFLSKIAKNLQNFDKYREQTIKKLVKLGYPPEEARELLTAF